MIRILLLPLFLIILFSSPGLSAQNITGKELLSRAIAYHDPDNAWSTFSGTLFITMETPNNSERKSEVTLNFPADYFKLLVRKDDTTTEEVIDKGVCGLVVNGKKIKKQAEDSTNNGGSCGQTEMMRNYYTYLYGLPMKLRDKGTIIDPAVVKKTFKGKEYLTLKVKYEEEVGKDTWYFYFNPDNYALEAYQFFHDEATNDGEYIMLETDNFETINGIKIPKKRSWYTNKEDRLLGTDILTRASQNSE
ncbi:DUF6503 family protein [Muriicola sp. E247]|uniref:DUF6503 family protein n=1 Tax=Muriicola sp. E247 TaxID=3242730 RepID=UPI003526941C